ncbi:MAG: DUF6090 family protein [Robiginitalea sp.]|uniref:DUF6090 family protein n=2 Tax=Robiginitalea sp. TaxID=1902411 RepID=UPI003C70AA52
MLRFFRQIRQRLLTDNKFSKYILYALGEILLVVIGILIALQVSNYNETVNRKKAEQKALNNLQLDFEYNLSRLKEGIGFNENNLKACMKILDYTGKRYSSTFQIDSVLGETSNSYQYFPQNGFLLDLINSGNLGLIENDLLRNRLSLWLPSLETLKNREAICIEFDNDMIRYIFKYGSWLDSDKADRDETIVDLRFPESGFETDNRELLKSLEFENMIENQVVFLATLLEEQRNCLNLNQEILTLINASIE